jgi:hypothetical protein
MEEEAASAGLYAAADQKLPKVQILTAVRVIDGKRPRFRSVENPIGVASGCGPDSTKSHGRGKARGDQPGQEQIAQIVRVRRAGPR